jgi:hypothetical protein
MPISAAGAGPGGSTVRRSELLWDHVTFPAALSTSRSW